MKKKYLKILLIILFTIILQGIFYFITKLVMGQPTILGSSLDSKIPFINYSIIIYTSWYLFLFIIPLILYKSKSELFTKYILSYLTVSIISDIIFILFPTIVIRPVLQSNNFFNSFTNIIYNIDNPAVNCFPSLHVSVCVIWITYLSIEKTIKMRFKIPMIIISLLIIVSTLLTKQHVIMDVIGGIVIALIVCLIYENSKKLVFSITSKLKLE